jgi:hypothetical protein
VREPATESGELPNQKTFFRVGMGKREQVRGSSTPSPTRFPSRKIFFHACFPPLCAPAGRLRPRSPPRSSDPGAPQLHRAAPIWARPNPTARLQPLRAAHLHLLLHRLAPARIPAGGLAKTPIGLLPISPAQLQPRPARLR